MGLVACSSSHSLEHSPKQKTSKAKAKNLILMIGDGMGPAQISLLYYTLKHSKNSELMNTNFGFDRMAQHSFAVSETAPHGALVTDSACSATHLSTGHEALNQTLGINYKGESVPSILQKAQKKGLSTGLVSDTRATHATVAAFGAHVTSRWNEDEIAVQLLETAPTVLLSGGANRFLPAGAERELGGAFLSKSRREDERDLLQEAADAGYHLSHSRGDLKIASNKLEAQHKILGLFTDNSYESSLWFHQHKNSSERTPPSLLEMSQSAIEHLSKNDEGFFLMIEGGQIDWAGHQNDSGSLLHEMLSFNETLNWVVDWVKAHPDTLLVVTADHETGGFGFSYNLQDIPPPQPFPGKQFGDESYASSFNFVNPRNLDQLYHQKQTMNELWRNFQSLPSKAKTSNELRRLIHQATGFMLSKAEADKILLTTRNPYYNPSHRTTRDEYIPKISDFSAFYYDANNSGTALIARALSPYLGVVWGTGGHTAAPVHVYSLGPFGLTQNFSGHLTHPEIGRKLQLSLGLLEASE